MKNPFRNRYKVVFTHSIYDGRWIDTELKTFTRWSAEDYARRCQRFSPSSIKFKAERI